MRRIRLLIIFLTAQTLHADATFVYRTISGGPDTIPSESIQTRQIKGLKTRDEQKISASATPAQRTVVLLTDVERGLLQIVNPDERLYDEVRLREIDPATKRAVASSTMTLPVHEITTADVRVTKTTETATIGGYACRRFVVRVDLQAKDLTAGTTQQIRVRQVLWMAKPTADLKRAIREDRAFSQAYQRHYGDEIGTTGVYKTAGLPAFTGDAYGELTDELRRAGQALRKIKGFPVRTRIDYFKEGAAALLWTESELISVSLAPISDESFIIPKGYAQSFR
jgi:hypothetical protein